MGRQAFPVALALYDDLVAGVGEPVESAIAQDGIVWDSSLSQSTRRRFPHRGDPGM